MSYIQPSLQLLNGEYDFVEEPSQDVFCPVTFEVLRDPHQTTCCGHHISATASARLQQEGKPCPMCKEPNFTTHTDKYFKRVVNGLKVRCPHKGSGCEWMGDLGSRDQHTDLCPKRRWQCQYCDFTATYDVGGNEHLSQCKKFPEPCPNRCKTGTVERCDLERHLATECPLQLVACEYSHVGCTEKVPRKDLARHMEENMQKHLLNMSLLNLSLTRELHEKMDEKDRQIAELQVQLKHLVEQKFQRLDERVEQLQDLMAGSSHTREFTVTKFRQWKGKDWYSEPFYYSSIQGYKFKFNLDFCRSSTAIEIYLVLLDGEHDNKLLWPVKCITSIWILNQEEDHNHIERTESLEWNRGSSEDHRRIDKIRYSSLGTQTHLKGDCLRCKLRIIIQS